MKFMFSYRGDNRDPQALRDTGGFVPKYLLAPHAGGFDGFLACANKTVGKMGCNCPGFGETDLYRTARQKFQEILTTPDLLQTHVMHGKLGYLATATNRSDAYVRAHMYKFAVEFRFDLPVADARTALGIVGGRSLTMITRRFRILCNASSIANATLMAAIPHGNVELTFLSPVEDRYCSEV